MDGGIKGRCSMVDYRADNVPVVPFELAWEDGAHRSFVWLRRSWGSLEYGPASDATSR